MFITTDKPGLAYDENHSDLDTIQHIAGRIRLGKRFVLTHRMYRKQKPPMCRSVKPGEPILKIHHPKQP
jgi:hypothetical protein